MTLLFSQVLISANESKVAKMCIQTNSPVKMSPYKASKSVGITKLIQNETIFFCGCIFRYFRYEEPQNRKKSVHLNSSRGQ